MKEQERTKNKGKEGKEKKGKERAKKEQKEGTAKKGKEEEQERNADLKRQRKMQERR